MKIMSGSPCLHYDCSNRNSFGYCKTTVCINERYQREQWGLPSTTNKSESVVIKQQTNADRIRAMTDEKLAEFLKSIVQSMSLPIAYILPNTFIESWLDWLRQEVEEGKE